MEYCYRICSGDPPAYLSRNRRQLSSRYSLGRKASQPISYPLLSIQSRSQNRRGLPSMCLIFHLTSFVVAQTSAPFRHWTRFGRVARHISIGSRFLRLKHLRLEMALFWFLLNLLIASFVAHPLWKYFALNVSKLLGLSRELLVAQHHQDFNFFQAAI